MNKEKMKYYVEKKRWEECCGAGDYRDGKADAYESVLRLIKQLDESNQSEEELLNQAEEIENIALGFTHPRFEEYYPEWNAVYNLAINVKEYIKKESAK